MALAFNHSRHRNYSSYSHYRNYSHYRSLAALLLFMAAVSLQAQNSRYVDPRIGSVGVGRTFPGPSMPFGMAKPGPDCGVLPNAGWAPMPAAVSGFSQTHISGTGGGQKYGNILIQPFFGNGMTRTDTDVVQKRVSETISLGYYATTYENGIRTEITTGERCTHYRLHYPNNSSLTTQHPSLLIDATHFLGKDPVPDLRERQQFVGAEVEVMSDHEVQGYSRIRGGWNNGDAYTVYFCLQTDQPFKVNKAIGTIVTIDTIGTIGTINTIGTIDTAGTIALNFADTLVNVKVGLSYVSTMQARRNIDSRDFDAQLALLRQAWEQQLGKVDIDGTEQQRRMFYTALYHTMLMPVCKTGENPKWSDAPYYDDYYAIWDTYRTSSPLLTLLCPERQIDIINSLLNIRAREGFMPDARSGDSNGRTQGGSNADVVIADAFVKGLGRDSAAIDYDRALEAMLRDGEADPGADHERHGRGGLREYLSLGYVPYGIPRAGTRTVEYSYDDYCIAQVARGLGRDNVYAEYMQRSRYWRNLWRSDYEWDDVRGYIMPRDDHGRWLDSVTWGRSKIYKPQIPYTPVTKVAPWYLPWWDTFFYEALSAEYSLSIPHDVEGLIDACGGSDAFRRRLDLFFERGRYNVGNEPSFLTPCLYHWIGRPDLSTQRIRQIVNDNYSDAPDGLPGNDDSGAMSSWLAFHMMGIYPNAGQDYYLLNVPLVDAYTLRLSNGRTLQVTKQGRGDDFVRVLFNGRELAGARITHQELMQGGRLAFVTSKTKKGSAHSNYSNYSDYRDHSNYKNYSDYSNYSDYKSYTVAFMLNRQQRRWPLRFATDGDTLTTLCNKTVYRTAMSDAAAASAFCWLTPQADSTVYHAVSGTFLTVSPIAIQQLKANGSFTYDGITWRRLNDGADDTYHVRADVDGTEMTLLPDAVSGLAIVAEMRRNPLGIDWTVLGADGTPLYKQKQ